MDADRFESLLRSLSPSPSRRRALRLLAGLVLGSPLALGTPGTDAHDTSAKCKKLADKDKRKKCLKKAKKHLARHGRQTPRCSDGLTDCGGGCVNTHTDEANCGSCGTGCATTQVCQAGSCFPQSTCPAFGPPACGPSATACGPDCGCGVSAEGNIVCIQSEPACEAPTPCTTSADCPFGKACIDISGCCETPLPPGSRNCFAPCAAPAV